MKTRLLIGFSLVVLLGACNPGRISRPPRKATLDQATYNIPLHIPAKFPGGIANYNFYIQKHMSRIDNCPVCAIDTNYFSPDNSASPIIGTGRDTTVIDTAYYHVELKVNKRGKVRVLNVDNYCSLSYPDSCVKNIKRFFNEMPLWDSAREWNNKTNSYRKVSQIIYASYRFDKLAKRPRLEYSYDTMINFYTPYSE